MKIVILGCGRVGGILATRLHNEGHDVTVIDINADAFRRRGPDFKGRKVIGNGCDVDVLQRAGVGEADAFIALSPGDNRNVMAAQIAKMKFKVPRVIARINDPLRAYAYEELGIETLCHSTLVSSLLHDMVMGQRKDVACESAPEPGVAQEA